MMPPLCCRRRRTGPRRLLLWREGTVIGIEGRGKINDYVSPHEGKSKRWAGPPFWTPDNKIFRDPRWGRGQETYGEDPYLAGEIVVEFIKGIQGDDPNYFIEKRHPIPSDVLQAAGSGRLTVRFVAKRGLAGGLYDVRLLEPGAPEILQP
jgi:hypothetical protein